MYKGFVRNKQEYDEIVDFLQNGEVRSDFTDCAKSRFIKKCKNFIMIGEKLYLKGENPNEHKKVIITEDLDMQELYAQLTHISTSHIGVNKLENLLNTHYFGIKREIIRKVVADCEACSKSQPLKHNGPLKNITAKKPFERLQIDLIDLRRYKNENSGFSWVLTIIDVFSKYAFVQPMKSKTAENTAISLSEIFDTYGDPQIVQSDNGTEFIAHQIEEVFKNRKILKICSRPRHPQSNGQIERFNQTLTRFFSKNLHQQEKCWITILKKTVMDYNNTIHSSHKKSPFELFFNRKSHNSSRICIEQTDNAIDNENSSDISLSIENSDIIIEKYACKKYIDRMNRNSSVHVSKYTFKKNKLFI
ncbi:transposable element [Pseudoloma neurophilia]|uniref:Transposable element n=1 Tax=Pseudoloma neurophilia TaxID=146866 RepID=A0A0R0LZ93_9MICR|nr:transposable element [Pseudoloma neurophilia]